MKKPFTQLTATYSDGFKIVEVCVSRDYAENRLRIIEAENAEDVANGTAVAVLTGTKLEAI